MAIDDTGWWLVALGVLWTLILKLRNLNELVTRKLSSGSGVMIAEQSTLTEYIKIIPLANSVVELTGQMTREWKLI
tara:strand:- start:350 stop:577 length:228 start_codon:yes stop_codon:yes gene_type:complete